MRPVIKAIHSPDIFDFSTHVPEDTQNFCFLLEIDVGPADEEGADTFDIVVCTPKWLSEHYNREDILVGRHYLIAFEYNFSRIIQGMKSSSPHAIATHGQRSLLRPVDWVDGSLKTTGP
jgi:hypothetical protein